MKLVSNSGDNQLCLGMSQNDLHRIIIMVNHTKIPIEVKVKECMYVYKLPVVFIFCDYDTYLAHTSLCMVVWDQWIYCKA